MASGDGVRVLIILHSRGVDQPFLLLKFVDEVVDLVDDIRKGPLRHITSPGDLRKNVRHKKEKQLGVNPVDILALPSKQFDQFFFFTESPVGRKWGNGEDS